MELTFDQKINRIKEICLKEESKNPIEIAIKIMKESYVSIHGPEHHIIDGAAFLTAMHNAGVEFDLEVALEEQIVRGRKMPGATCGQWGMCGASSSVGAALAIVHSTGPLSNNEYYKDNLRLTSIALAKIAEIGGPRCCKRNAFLSITAAIQFVKEKYGIELESSDIQCDFTSRNKQCIRNRCPFYQGDENSV